MENFIFRAVKYHRTLPKIKETVMEHWHIKPYLAEIFQNPPPILAFHENKNLREIIGTKLIENGKIKRKSTYSI